MRKLISILLLTSILISMPITLVNGQEEGEAPYDHFYFKPTDYIFNFDNKSVGDTFRTEIYFNGTEDIYSWQIYLTFNGTLLNVTDVGYMPDEPVHQEPMSIPVPPVIDNDTGVVIYGYSSLGPSHNVTVETGLCYIEFQIIESPPAGGLVESDLTLVPGPGVRVSLWQDSVGLSYFPDVTNGYYAIPEFLLFLIAPVLIIATTIAIIFRKRLHQKIPVHTTVNKA